MNTKGSMETFDNKDDKGSNVVAPASPTFVEQEKQDHEGNLPSCPLENDGKIGQSCQSSNVLVDDICKRYDQLVAQYMQPVVGYKDCGKKIGSEVGDEHIVTVVERQSEVGQSQLGKRRRLEIEITQEKNVENDPGSQNLSNNATESEIQDSFCDDIQNTTNSSFTISKPLGIGVHLNNIVNGKPLGNVSVKQTKGSYSSGGDKSSLMQNDMQCPSISLNSNLDGNVSGRIEEFTHQNQTPVSMKTTEHQEKFEQGSLNFEQDKRVDDFDQSKRKKTESTGGDGCKHCNCKKTKCLKLFCDCFSAGIYCTGPCSCQGCFNRSEYEDTVLKTRQQIESRNPLAFAPKIVHRLRQPPINQTVEDADQLTPPVAGRHIRGCNCKKSMCLKKYCECYQSNVGCSDGCRCEGCHNIYGAKAGSGMNSGMGMEAINQKLNDLFHNNIKVRSTKSKSSLPEIHKPRILIPKTPSFQCSNHGKNPSNARVFSGRYVPSPESNCTFYPPPHITPLRPPERCTIL